MSYQKIKPPAGNPAMPPAFLMKMMFALNITPPAPDPVFVKPDNWGEMTPEERRNARLDHWAQGKGIKFADSTAESKYKERAKLIRDAVTVGVKPERVPAFSVVGVYPMRRVGLTAKSIFYDQWNDAALSHVKFHTDFKPDAAMFNFANSGEAYELLDYQVIKWPGYNLPAEQSYQYNEEEFMKGDEYHLLLRDTSDFIMRVVTPRMFKGLSGLAQMPQFFMGAMGGNAILMPFLIPEVNEALKKLKKAAELTALTLPAVSTMLDGPPIQGFPQFYGSLSLAPFDLIGDVMRSTRGILTDMFRRKDELIEACDRFSDLMLESPLMQFSSSPLVFIPLHKGADRFMSQEQFETFYWPSLKKLMLGLVEDGFIPAPFAEGTYDKRLEIIADFPKGSAMWLFDQSDMRNVAKVLGDKLAFAGNVPSSLTVTGTPDQMTAYCKDLIETCGPTGNFILTNGCQVDEAKEENLHAMLQSVKKFKV
ncbi:MAG: hypothetical protein JEZ06_20620 [Anaerolineaceae bacterium]|nr:hypothetical protein [Anaerolineaceae bacterium]